MNFHERPTFDELNSEPSNGTYIGLDGYYRSETSVGDNEDPMSNDNYLKALTNFHDFVTSAENGLDPAIREASLANFQRVTSGIAMEAAEVQLVSPVSERIADAAMTGSEVVIETAETHQLGDLALTGAGIEE